MTHPRESTAAHLLQGAGLKPRHAPAWFVDMPAWYVDALCRQVGDAFFPEKGQGDQSRAAKAICRRCLVRDQCLRYAFEMDERYGVWGGTSEYDRRGHMRRKTCMACGQPRSDVRSPYCKACDERGVA